MRAMSELLVMEGVARRWLAAGALGAAVFVAGCGGGSSTTRPRTVTPPPPTGPTYVTVGNNIFTPSTSTVPAGSTVTWTWDSCTGGDSYGAGQTCVNHSVFWDADAATSGLRSSGSYQKAFPTAGSYAYHCLVHGSAMAGTVVVQ